MLFVIHCVDKPGSRDVRLANREEHLAYARRFTALIGGPLLDDDGEMCGSCLVLELDDRAAAEAFVARDPYTSAGLFERVDVHAFRHTLGPQPSS